MKKQKEGRTYLFGKMLTYVTRSAGLAWFIGKIMNKRRLFPYAGLLFMGESSCFHFTCYNEVFLLLNKKEPTIGSVLRELVSYFLP